LHAFVIAGTHSGVGKTTVTLGLLAALCKRGLAVQPFKVGPDFIDPGHHTAVTGVPSRNLDGWMLSREYNQDTFRHNIQGHDVGVIEGVMGLFDGYDGKSEAGSTAEMAKWLGLPVILVVDASAMARSAAALIHGFQSFDPNLNVTGVIFNRIGGPGHLHYLCVALEGRPDIVVLGGLSHNADITIPERHLGLVTPEEHRLGAENIERLATFIEDKVDLDLLLRATQFTHPLTPVPPSSTASGERRGGKRIRFGIVRDEAFCFYYPENLELLERAGAALVFFSPLHDTHLPPDLQGIYLGGGYPEVHAAKLSSNVTMRQEIKAFIEDGKIVYAECGGFMYLNRGIRTTQGEYFPMVDIYPTVVRMLSRRSALGYTEVEVASTAEDFPALRLRGHEFHYSELEQDIAPDTIKTIYQVRKRPTDPSRSEGYVYKRCLASYVHLHFGSNPEFARTLVERVQPCELATHKNELAP